VKRLFSLLNGTKILPKTDEIGECGKEHGQGREIRLPVLMLMPVLA
jgi:hypothetical protein